MPSPKVASSSPALSAELKGAVHRPVLLIMVETELSPASVSRWTTACCGNGDAAGCCAYYTSNMYSQPAREDAQGILFLLAEEPHLSSSDLSYRAVAPSNNGRCPSRMSLPLSLAPLRDLNSRACPCMRPDRISGRSCLILLQQAVSICSRVAISQQLCKRVLHMLLPSLPDCPPMPSPASSFPFLRKEIIKHTTVIRSRLRLLRIF